MEDSIVGSMGGRALEPPIFSTVFLLRLREPFDLVLLAGLVCGTESGIGTGTSLVMMFSTFTLAGFRLVGIRDELFAVFLEEDEDEESETEAAAKYPNQKRFACGGENRSEK